MSSESEEEGAGGTVGPVERLPLHLSSVIVIIQFGDVIGTVISLRKGVHK